MQRPGGDAAVVRIKDGPEGAGADRRRNAALLRGRSVRGRQAGRRRSLAQSHRGRREAARAHRQSQFRQSRAAGNHGPIHRLRARHRRRLRERSISRSCRATCRFTTRPTAGRSCRRRPSAVSVCSTNSPSPMTLAFKARGRGDPADRRRRGLARPIDLSARYLRPGGGCAAAGRSCRRAPSWRFRPRADPRWPRDGGARYFRRRLAGRARRDGDGVTASAPCSRRRAGTPAHAFWFGEDQARYVVTAKDADAIVAGGRKRPACRSRRLGATGGRSLAIAGERPLPVRTSADASRPGCRPIWPGRRKCHEH